MGLGSETGSLWHFHDIFIIYLFFMYLLAIFMQAGPVQLQAGLNGGLQLKARPRKYTWQRKNRFSRKVSTAKLELLRNGTGTYNFSPKLLEPNK